MNYATSATAEYDAELTLLHVLEEIPTPGSAQEAMATAAEQVDKLIKPDKRKMTKVKTEIRIGKRFKFAAEELRVDFSLRPLHIPSLSRL